MQIVKSLGNFDRVRTIRARTDVFARQYQFDKLMRQLCHAGETDLPDQIVRDLYAHWGDPIGEATAGYLRSAFNHTVQSNGHILQCGVNLLTLLLGICASRAEKQKHVWCLTEDPHWANVVRSWLTQYSIANTHIIVARPQLGEGYVWYGVDAKQFPGDFGLVLCEGGAASPGGIVGFTEKMEHIVNKNCTLLPRFVVKPKDQRHLHRWAECNGKQVVLLNKKEGFFKVSVAVAAKPKTTPLPG